jgi:hypothetical protein
MILETERGNCRLHSVHKSFWKKVWTCRKTDCVLNVCTSLLWMSTWPRSSIQFHKGKPLNIPLSTIPKLTGSWVFLLVFVIGTPCSCDQDPYLLNTIESNLALQGANNETVCLSVMVLLLFIQHQFTSNPLTIGRHAVHILIYNTPLPQRLIILLRPVAWILI